MALSNSLWTGTEGTLFRDTKDSLLVQDGYFPPVINTGSLSDTSSDWFTANNNWSTKMYKFKLSVFSVAIDTYLPW